MEGDFTFHWIALPQILVAFFLLAQGIIVFIQKPKGSLHQAFFLFQFPIFLWLFSMGLAYLEPDMKQAEFLVKLGFVGVMYIPVSTYAFSVFFLNDRRQIVFIYAGIFLTSFFTLFVNAPAFTRGAILYPWGYYISLGPLSVLSFLLFLLFVPLFVRNFYKKYLASQPEQKRWHFWALVAGIFAFFASVDFFPAFGIHFGFPPVGYLFVGSFVTLMGYFMMRHHLTDLKIIFGRSVGYIFLTLVLFLIYISFFLFLFPSIQTATDIITHALIFLISVYLISFAMPKSQKVIDEMFFKEKIDYAAFITSFNSELRNLTDTQTLMRIFFSFLIDRLRIQRARIFFYQENEKAWMVYRNGMQDYALPERINALASDSIKKYFIVNTKIIDARDYLYHPILDQARRVILKIFRDYEGKLLVPLTYRSFFLGFILIGEKASGESFSHVETHSLEKLAIPLSISLENARLYENIQNASKLKTDFVSIASHQLRTPLAGLRWSLDVLKKKDLGALNQEQYDLLNQISTITDRMIEIVSQLLEVVHIEEDRSKADVAELKLEPIIRDAISEKSALISQNNIHVEYKISRNASKILAHEKNFKTILSIFLDNALKYTPKGGRVWILARALEGRAQLSVKDTGIGIPKKEQFNIFNKFFRASNAQLVEPNGSGLGLFYAKTLLNRLGGEVWFRSEENRGTTFYFTVQIP